MRSKAAFALTRGALPPMIERRRESGRSRATRPAHDAKWVGSRAAAPQRDLASVADLQFSRLIFQRNGSPGSARPQVAISGRM